MNRAMITGFALLGAATPLLIDSALKGAVLLGVAGFAALALYRASAATRHLVWVFAVAALLALPVLSASLPRWRVLPWAAVSAPVESSRKVTMPPMALNAHSPVLLPVVAPTASAMRLEVKPRLPRDVRDWLPVAWAAGCALLFARLLASYWLLSRATRRCAVVQDARLAEILEAARKRLDVRPQVQVRLDARRTIPLIWGVWRPRLLLPAAAVEWNDSQLRSVLLHELAHVKRRDLAVQCLLQAACALHWFNPLVWLAAWRLQAEGERACDDLVLASGVRASEYAEHLLRVATRFVSAPGAHAAGLAMARPSQLEGRLVAVLNERLNRRGVTGTLMWLGLAAGLGVVIPVAMLRAAEDNKPARGAGDAAVTQEAKAPQAAAAPVAPPAAKPLWRTGVVRKGNLTASITAKGTVEPEEVVDVGAQVSGQILEFGIDKNGKLIDYGSIVERNMLLAKIDPALLKAAVDVASAVVASDKAGEAQAEANLEQMIAKEAQAEADWKRAQTPQPVRNAGVHEP